MPPDNLSELPSFGVSDFVAVFNQTLEMAYTNVVIVGELANFRVSKNRWVYFDLKDEFASVKFFGSVYMLPGPLEDGLMLQVRGAPRLHPQYGFSVNIQSIQPVGEGSLRKAAALLEAKLKAEGLFDEGRKRALPYPPTKIGLITSEQSAAYADFVKIINQRWSGLDIELADVQVQGEAAPGQLVAAINFFNAKAQPADLLVIIRGGGSADDLGAYNKEQVTRAVAASRIPTLVAIGHEVDLSLSELVADKRASTPSNAAELLVPDKRDERARLTTAGKSLGQNLTAIVNERKSSIKQQALHLNNFIVQYLDTQKLFLTSKNDLLRALSPQLALQRGFAIVREQSTGKVIKSLTSLKTAQDLSVQLKDGQFGARVTKIDKTET